MEETALNIFKLIFGGYVVLVLVLCNRYRQLRNKILPLLLYGLSAWMMGEHIIYNFFRDFQELNWGMLIILFGFNLFVLRFLQY